MISVCFITKNEEDWIEEAIQHLRPLVSQVVVYDTGSTDQTVQMARRLGADVIEAAWPGDFSTARNESLKLASQPWILRIDPDERLSPLMQEKIKAFVSSAPDDVHAVQCLTRNYTNSLEAIRDEGFQLCSPETPELIWARSFRGYLEMGYTRLFRRRAEIQFVGLVHEGVDPTVQGRIERRMDIVFHHYGTDPAQIRKKQKRKQYKELLLKQTQRAESNWFDWQALGLEFLEDQDFENASKYFMGALHKTDFSPNRLNLLSNLGWCFLQLDQFKPAQEHLELALSIDSEHLSSLLNLADLHLRQEQPSAALKTLNQALKAHVTSPLLWRALGQVFGKLNDWSRSQQAFEKSLNLAPDFVEARVDLAILLNHLDQAEAARSQLSEAFKIDPQNTRALKLSEILT